MAAALRDAHPLGRRYHVRDLVRLHQAPAAGHVEVVGRRSADSTKLFSSCRRVGATARCGDGMVDRKINGVCKGRRQTETVVQTAVSGGGCPTSPGVPRPIRPTASRGAEERTDAFSRCTIWDPAAKQQPGPIFATSSRVWKFSSQQRERGQSRSVEDEQWPRGGDTMGAGPNLSPSLPLVFRCCNGQPPSYGPEAIVLPPPAHPLSFQWKSRATTTSPGSNQRTRGKGVGEKERGEGGGVRHALPACTHHATRDGDVGRPRHHRDTCRATSASSPRADSLADGCCFLAANRLHTSGLSASHIGERAPAIMGPYARSLSWTGARLARSEDRQLVERGRSALGHGKSPVHMCVHTLHATGHPRKGVWGAVLRALGRLPISSETPPPRHSDPSSRSHTHAADCCCCRQTCCFTYRPTYFPLAHPCKFHKAQATHALASRTHPAPAWPVLLTAKASSTMSQAARFPPLPPPVSQYLRRLPLSDLLHGACLGQVRRMSSFWAKQQHLLPDRRPKPAYRHRTRRARDSATAAAAAAASAFFSLVQARDIKGREWDRPGRIMPRRWPYLREVGGRPERPPCKTRSTGWARRGAARAPERTRAGVSWTCLFSSRRARIGSCQA